MKKTLTAAITTALVIGAASTTFAAANPFTDVPAGHWSYDAVAKLAQDGVIEGYGDGTFRGDKAITRYEMAQMVAKAMAKSDVSAADKAAIDKLAAEYSAELNNLGVRVGELENKVDNVKWGGKARLRVDSQNELNGAILATGFPFKQPSLMPTQFAIMNNLIDEAADFRRTGSAALDLCYVASGRVDGYFELSLKPWDFAAGELIAREAGAIVCDFTGGHNYMTTGNIVAGNPRVVKAMLANMREELSDALKR